MNKYLLILPFLCSTVLLRAQTDTVSNKISKIPYKHVDAIAKFPQGDFKTYITHSLQINHTVEYSIKGQIILLMGIDADGGVSHVSVLKSLSPQIDPEVVQVIKASPKWKPAMLNNQSISMDMVLNIDLAVNGINPPPAKPKVVKPVIIPPVIAKAVTAPVKKPLPVTAKAATPIVAKKPTPVVAKKVVPPVVKKPAPAVAKKVAPLVVKKPIPIVKKPEPIAAKKVVPPVVKKPEPVITKKIEPPVVKKPAPVVVKKPEPVIAKKVVPPIVKKPEPVIAKKIEPPVVKKPPVVVKKPEPIVAKKIVPPVVKKLPVVVKKPAPVIAKKVEPPVIKKPIPVIAKKIIPPVIKKPTPAVKEPVVAKQTETTPVKKPKRIVVKGDFFHPTSNDAVFPGGGIPSFYRYLSENIAYPPGSKYSNIEGKVFITFTVEEDGSINDVEVESSPAEDLSQESIRVLLASPKWKPASQNGRNVPVSYTIPIKFTLGPKAN